MALCTMEHVLTVDKILCAVAGFLDARSLAVLETLSEGVREGVVRSVVWGLKATGVALGLGSDLRMARRWKRICLQQGSALRDCFHAFPSGGGVEFERSAQQEWDVSQARVHIGMINLARDCFSAIEKYTALRRARHHTYPPHLAFHPYGHQTSPSPTPPGSLRRKRVKPMPPTPPGLPLGPFFP
eukprot:TRINITY_DN7143_c2_g1_i1.p1 TRINITY_DN7143_c2_g1~~TRINITY_DN7143_c2_g1_i1.p1  ORF type:complete len:185 (+),score=61.40 TRINITY_DN7143_c2_g1_i1:47-601(+)